jgi:hypothetical protein
MIYEKDNRRIVQFSKKNFLFYVYFNTLASTKTLVYIPNSNYIIIKLYLKLLYI